MKKTIQNRVLPVVAMLAFLFTGFVSNRATAQTYICNGDSVCFDATGARGNIDWWVSTGGGAWSVVGSGDHFCTIPPVGDHMAVGSISEGTCDTIWTDTLHVIVNTTIDITTTSDTLLLADCNGTLTGLASIAGMSVSGGISPYTYEWTPASGLSSTIVMDPDFTGSGSVGFFTYTITVTDSVGCNSTHNIVIHVDPQGTSTFNFTGSLQTFTVPSCVDTVFVQAWGAQGGSGATGGASVAGGTGGLGGYAEGWLLVSPGDVLNVLVGGQGATPTGGFNGGGNGGSTNAGGGGGASDVRVGGTAEVNRIITAGGGGGGGRGGCDEGSASTGGIGGAGSGGGSGLAGTNGNDSPTSGGVAGGGKGGNFAAVQGAGGPKGVGCASFSGTDGNTTATGSGATGGAGQTCCCSSAPSVPGGGGGGGGQVGGGGGGGGSAGTTGCSGNSKGAGGGGGGGSSFTGGVISGVTNPSIWLGNGQVSFSW